MKLEKRKLLKNMLQRGDQTQIARDANVSTETVRKWLNGKIKKSSIEPYVLRIALKRNLENKKVLNDYI